MRNLENIIVKGVFVLLLFTLGATAQDMKNKPGKMKHQLQDNKLIHAAEITLQPGEKTDMHTHPAHFFYALSDGKIVIHYKDGKDETMELKAGESGYGEPERPHVTENVGSTTVKFLIVELKEHPYKEGKGKEKQKK